MLTLPKCHVIQNFKMVTLRMLTTLQLTSSPECTRESIFLDDLSNVFALLKLLCSHKRVEVVVIVCQ
jgi:hypothetical protein